MAKQKALPWELKYQFALGGWTDIIKGCLYAIRKKYGAAAALEIFDMVCKMDNRIKNVASTLQTIFNLQGNDAETIGEVFDIWDELTGIESTILERSQTVNRRKVIKCPWKTEPTDISDWNLPFIQIITKTINPKVTFERPTAMCAGAPHCEYVWKLEESTQIKGAVESMAKKVGIPWELKYKFTMR